MSHPINRMVESTVRCTICGAAYGKCDCWIRCAFCGWSFEKGTKCRNPQCKSATSAKWRGGARST